MPVVMIRGLIMGAGIICSLLYSSFWYQRAERQAEGWKDMVFIVWEWRDEGDAKGGGGDKVVEEIPHGREDKRREGVIIKKLNLQILSH